MPPTIARLKGRSFFLAAATAVVCTAAASAAGPRPDVPGAWRSPLGIQIHPVCFTYGQSQGIEKGKLEQAFSSAIADAYQQMQACGGKYPELKPYISEWNRKLAVTVVTCSRGTTKELKFGAINPSASGLARYLLEDEEQAGIELPVNPFASLQARDQDMVILPYNTIKDVTSARSLGVTQKIMHEVLHSTHANNHPDHDEVQRIEGFLPPSPNFKGAACHEHVMDDRVNVIEALCTRYKPRQFSSEASLHVFDRISSCGFKRGCQDLFGKDAAPNGNWIWQSLENKYLFKKGLGTAKAASLCARIYDDGACLHARRTSGMNYTRDNPALRELGLKIRRRLDELVPHDRVEFSGPLLSEFPHIQGDLEMVRHSSCFGEGFEDTATGGVLIKFAEPLHGPHAPAMRFGHALSMARAVASGACGKNLPVALESALLSLERDVQPLFSTPLYADFLEKRYGGTEGEEKWSLDMTPADRDMARVMGSRLVEDYFAGLARFHHASPRFDCLASGFSPIASASQPSVFFGKLAGPASSCK